MAGKKKKNWQQKSKQAKKQTEENTKSVTKSKDKPGTHEDLESSHRWHTD